MPFPLQANIFLISHSSNSLNTCSTARRRRASGEIICVHPKDWWWRCYPVHVWIHSHGHSSSLWTYPDPGWYIHGSLPCCIRLWQHEGWVREGGIGSPMVDGWAAKLPNLQVGFVFVKACMCICYMLNNNYVIWDNKHVCYDLSNIMKQAFILIICT